MRWWPPWRRRDGDGEQAQEALAKARGELERAQQQDSRVGEVADRALDVARRTGRFTSDVDRALRLRRTT